MHVAFVEDVVVPQIRKKEIIETLSRKAIESLKIEVTHTRLLVGVRRS
jgi:hypothetical protein